MCYFYHKAMTHTVPVNYHPGSTKNRGHFRKCRNNKETLAHELSECQFSWGFWNDRHNSILKCVGKQITQYIDCTVWDCGWQEPQSGQYDQTVAQDTECQYALSRDRVDFQVYVLGSKDLYLIDVKCPYYMNRNMAHSNTKNLDHYQSLAEICRQAMPETSV